MVLAGGASRRFGSDKVFARVGSLRLIDLALASLADADGVTVMIGSPERLAATASVLPQGVTALADEHPGRGPMAGLATAAAHHRTSWIALLAVDLPLVPSSWWSHLASRHRPGALAIVPRDANGRWEPLAALYHGSLAAELAAALESGDPARLRLQDWLDDLESRGLVAAVDAAEAPAGALSNVNRRDDADRVAAVLRALRGEARE